MRLIGGVLFAPMDARGTEFRVLGPVEPVRDGTAVQLGGAPQSALLAADYWCAYDCCA